MSTHKRWLLKEGPQNYQGPQPHRPQTVWAAAVWETVSKPQGQNPENEEQPRGWRTAFSPKQSGSWGNPLPTNQSHAWYHKRLTYTFTAFIYCNCNISALHCILHCNPLDQFTFVTFYLFLLINILFNIYLLYIVLLLLCVCWGS